MAPWFHTTDPDSLTGAVLAIEGIADAAVVLHGPTGCKFYHGALVDGQFPRSNALDPMSFMDTGYFGQARIPTTYLDDHDYVFGAAAKLTDMLPRVAAQGHALLAVINTPGAALIGEDLERCIAQSNLPIPCIALESPGFSSGFAHGFQYALITLLERLAPTAVPRIDRQVNLIGISLFQRHWQGSLAELCRLLEACGIGVSVTLCAGTSVEAIRNLRAASYNLVIQAELADQLVPWLEKELHLPSIISPAGAPIGFDATAAWLCAACQALECSPDPGLALLQTARQRNFAALQRVHSLTGLPTGATFALQAEAALAYPLTRWLHCYLGMVPVAIQVTADAGGYATALRDYLSTIACADAWNADITTQTPDVVLGSALLLAQLRGSGRSFAGVDIALPGQSTIDIVPKKLLGAEGALFIVEQILNGLYRLCP